MRFVYKRLISDARIKKCFEGQQSVGLGKKTGHEYNCLGKVKERP